MSLFGKILDKLGLSKAEAATPAAQGTPAAGHGTPAAGHGTPAASPPGATSAPASESSVPTEPSPVPVSIVDVKAHLDELAAANPQKLNWKQSIVDLLKLLDIDSSYAARKELAVELGCPEDLMHDSAQMNMWLHKTVLQKIADNGGNVPAELLD